MRLDRLVAFFPFLALAPFFQAYPERGAIGIARKTEKVESGYGSAIPNAGRGQRDVFNLLANCDGAFERSGVRELNTDIEKALVFLGQETGRKFFAKQAGCERD